MVRLSLSLASSYVSISGHYDKAIRQYGYIYIYIAWNNVPGESLARDDVGLAKAGFAWPVPSLAGHGLSLQLGENYALAWIQTQQTSLGQPCCDTATMTDVCMTLELSSDATMNVRSRVGSEKQRGGLLFIDDDAESYDEIYF